MRHRSSVLDGAVPAAALAAVLAATLAGAVAAVEVPMPYFDGAESTERIYTIDYDTGFTFEVDIRSSGSRLQVERLEQNIFREIGRQEDGPADPGHFVQGNVIRSSGRTEAFLLVETLTGFTTYLVDPGDDNLYGRIQRMAGRPFGEVAAGDGNFALLMRRADGGGTVGAYLYHGTTGACRMVLGLEELATDPTVRDCSDLPKVVGGLTAVPIADDEQRTVGYLVVDGVSGAVHLLSLNPQPTQITARTDDLNLADLFAAGQGEVPRRRFALAPITDSSGLTTHVLVADAASRRLALLRLSGTSGVQATLLPVDLTRYLRDDDPDRTLFAVPRQGGFGATLGVWIFDRGVSRAFLLDEPLSAQDRTLERVQVGR